VAQIAAGPSAAKLLGGDEGTADAAKTVQDKVVRFGEPDDRERIFRPSS
jgi:hypothetical protein